MAKISSTIFLCFLMSIYATADTLKVDKAKSRIHVDAKATGHAFTGTLQDYTATISGNHKSLEPSAFQLSWKFTDLKTEEQKRDEKMIEWLGGGVLTGTFKFIKTWQRDRQTYAQGKLNIHGVSKTINFPYTAKKDGDWLTINGTAKLDYTDFKLPVIRALAVIPSRASKETNAGVIS